MGYRAFEEVSSALWISRARQLAQRRRAALEAAGCSTYVLAAPGALGRIVCLCCGAASSNAWDMRERYCGFCHEYHHEGEDKADQTNHPAQGGAGEDVGQAGEAAHAP